VVSCLLKLVNFSRQFNHNKANFLFVTKTLNLGAYLFVMKKYFRPYLFSVLFIMFMSKQIRDPSRSKRNSKNFMDWWSYQYNEIMLSRDFVALDSNSKKLVKTFLKS
jgi:hypothetical protein